MSESETLADTFAAAAARGAPVLEAVYALLTSHAFGGELRVVEVGEHMATLLPPGGRPIRVFRYPASEEALHALVSSLLLHNTAEGTHLIVVGGDESVAQAVGTAAPRISKFPFLAWHLSDAGRVQGWPPVAAEKSPISSALRTARRLTPDEVRGLLDSLTEHSREFGRDRRDRAQFFRGMNQQSPRVTFGVLALIACMFVLQTVWSPTGDDALSSNLFTLSMGALYAPLVREGEWWRLISTGFLHGGLMHAVMNGVVLYLLGGQLERQLGSARFVILYVVALLSGSLLSLQLGSGFSVGASGAVWGLLGAQLCLAYRHPPLLPRSVADTLKPLARQNLLMNIGISFLPGIDWAAHAGGGLGGAALLLSGLLYAGEAAPDASSVRHPPPAWLVSGAIAAAILLGAGVVLALVHGEPWRAAEEIRLMTEQPFGGNQP